MHDSMIRVVQVFDLLPLTSVLIKLLFMYFILWCEISESTAKVADSEQCSEPNETDEW